MAKNTPNISAAISPEEQPKPAAGLRKFNNAEQQVNKVVASLTAITVISSEEFLQSAMEELKTAKGVEKIIEDKRKELVGPLNDEVKRINARAKSLTGQISAAVDDTKKVVLAYHQAEAAKALEIRTKGRQAQLISMGFVPVLDDKIGVVEFYAYGSSVVVEMFCIEKDDDAVWGQRITRAATDIEQTKAALLQSKEAELETASFFSTEEEQAVLRKDIADLQAAPAEIPAAAIPSTNSGSNRGLTKRWAYELVDIAQVPRGYLQLNEKAVREAIASGVRAIPGIRIFQEESITIR